MAGELDVHEANLRGAAHLYLGSQASAPLAQPQRLFAIPSCRLEVRYACVSQGGFRPEDPTRGCQDSLVVAEGAGGDDEALLVGVFDGHGECGAQCAAFAKRRLLPALAHAAAGSPADAAGSLAAALGALNAELHASDELDSSLSGAEAACVLLRGRELTVSNIGDVRVLLGRAPADGCADGGAAGAPPALDAVVLSSSHTPWRADERARLRAAGAEVASCDQKDGLVPLGDGAWEEAAARQSARPSEVDPPRVWARGADAPGCAFSRSLGDALGETVGVCAEPDSHALTLRPGDGALLIGSAGLFAFLSHERAMLAVARAAGPAEAARALVAEAGEAWLRHEPRVADLTAFVAFFEWLPDASAPIAAPPLPPPPSAGAYPRLRLSLIHI